MTVIADRPSGLVRDIRDCTPGEPYTVGERRDQTYYLRSAADVALALGELDEAGILTQDYRTFAAHLRDRGFDVPPDDQVHHNWLFPWGQARKSIEGRAARHDILVAVLRPYLSRRAVMDALPEIRKLADKLLDETLSGQDGALDLAGFGRRLAFRAISTVTGLPSDPNTEQAIGGYFAQFAQRDTVAAMAPASAGEQQLLEGFLHGPGNDDGLLGALAGAEGKTLSTAECVAMVWGTWFAGTHTTGAGVALTIGLLEEYRLLEEARRNLGDALSPGAWLLAAAREAVRLKPPFPAAPLRSTAPAALPASGLVIPPDRQVFALITAANRDVAAAGPDPGSFVPGRPQQPNFSFGSGLHQCTGRLLATYVMAVAAAAILTRTRSLRLLQWREIGGVVSFLQTADFAYEIA